MNKLGVDVYMDWKGFGKREMSNPNYKKQITGYRNVGKFGYLRVSYSSSPLYDILTKPFFWDWNFKISFNEKRIKKFIEFVEKFPKELEEKKKNG